MANRVGHRDLNGASGNGLVDSSGRDTIEDGTRVTFSEDTIGKEVRPVHNATTATDDTGVHQSLQRDRIRKSYKDNGTKESRLRKRSDIVVPSNTGFEALSQDESVCRNCYKEKSEHEVITEDKKQKLKCVSRLPTNAFGEIKFASETSVRAAKYIRLGVDVDMKKVLQLLTKDWAIKEPKLIIYVTRGESEARKEDNLEAQNEENPEAQENIEARKKETRKKMNKIFCEGVINACRSTDAWIITEGDSAYADMWRSADEVILKKPAMRPVIIGIAAWGRVFGVYDRGLDRTGKRLWVTPCCPVLDDTVFEDENCSDLDPNHSHFLFVDNHESKDVAEKIDLDLKNFGIKLLSALIFDGNQKVDIPVVNVVYGEDSAGEVIELGSNYDVPKVTVLESVGDVPKKLQAMDLNLKEEKSTNTTSEYVKRYAKKLELMIMRHALTFKLHQNEVSRENLRMELQTSLDWNQPDLAREIIENPEPMEQGEAKKNLSLPNDCAIDKQEKLNRKFTQSELTELFSRALHKDNDKFIAVCQQYGFDIGIFLTVNELERLYKTESYDDDTQSEPTLLGRRLVRAQSRCHRLRTVFHECLQCHCHSSCNNCRKESQANGGCSPCCQTAVKPYSLSNVGELLSQLIYHYEPTYLKNNNSSDSTIRDTNQDILLGRPTLIQKPHLKRPIHDLFIWAILAGKFKIAKRLLVQLDDRMAAALTAVNIIQRMSSDASVNERAEYLEQAEKYKTFAERVLNRCQQAELALHPEVTDESRTENLILRRQEYFGNTTCLQLAADGRCMNFVAHPATFNLLDKLWYGQISSECRVWRIILCMILFVPVLTDFLPFVCDRNVKEKSADSKAGGDKDAKWPDGTEGSEKSKHDTSTIFVPGPLMWYMRLYYFFAAPIVVFSYNCVFYLVFLGLFSHALLSEFGEAFSTVEWVLLVWVVSLFVEEQRQLIKLGFKMFFDRRENWLDQFAVWIALLAFLLRVIMINFDVIPAQMMDVTIYLLALSLALFYMRLLLVFFVHHELGPTLLMIRQMSFDLLRFLLILGVFFFAYGVIYRALLFRPSPSSWELFFSVLRAAYWPMHGEVSTFFEQDVEKGCDIDGSGRLIGCTHYQLVAAGVMGIYVLFVSILLFNLLIALFNKRFSDIQMHQIVLWRFYVFYVLRDYRERPFFAPPFILILHILQLIFWILKSCFSRCRISDDDASSTTWLDFEWPWDRQLRLEFNSTKGREMEEELKKFEKTFSDLFIFDRDSVESVSETVETDWKEEVYRAYISDVELPSPLYAEYVHMAENVDVNTPVEHVRHLQSGRVPSESADESDFEQRLQNIEADVKMILRKLDSLKLQDYYVRIIEEKGQTGHAKGRAGGQGSSPRVVRSTSLQSTPRVGIHGSSPHLSSSFQSTRRESHHSHEHCDYMNEHKKIEDVKMRYQSGEKINYKREGLSKEKVRRLSFSF